MKSLDEDDMWVLRYNFHQIAGDWESAENDPCYIIRLKAFLNTKNWKKAEKDTHVKIRYAAYKHRGNLVEKIENDEEVKKHVMALIKKIEGV